MAYTKINQLDLVDGKPLHKCSPDEDNYPSPFYVEDVIRLTNQPDFNSIKKHMATFWGKRWQVWVGYDSSGKELEGVVILRCPPFYPPWTTQNKELTKDDKPTDPVDFETSVKNFGEA